MRLPAGSRPSRSSRRCPTCWTTGERAEAPGDPLHRVFVTGLGGFVGSHLIRGLTARGDEVYGFGIGEPPSGSLVAGWWKGDVLDAEGLAAAVASARPARVIHLAGQSSAARSFEHPVETYRANALGTWMTLDAVARHAPDARVLVVGSGEVYGPQPMGTRVAEHAPFRPISPYAMSKAAADALSEAFARRHGLEVVRTRSFGHTGPGQAPVFAVPSFARQIASIESGGQEPVLRVGNLEVTRDLTDVRDVVDAYLALFERGRPGVAYNVCRGEGVLLSEIVARMVQCARVGIRVEVDPARVRSADLAWLVGDPGAIERDTGWRATTSLDRTLEDVMEDARARPRVD